MEDHTKITHEQLVSYLYGKLDKETQRQIHKINKEDPVYHLFFELIDKLKPYAKVRTRIPDAIGVFLTFSDIEEMLMRFFSGDIRRTEAQKFFDWLVASPIFYRRLLTKLIPASPEIEVEEIPELAPVPIKSDEEILKEILTEAKKPKLKTRDIDDIIIRAVTEVWNYLRKLVAPPIRVPRYAFVISVVIMAIVFSVLIYKTAIRRFGYDYYVYDDQIPYQYDLSSLRGIPLGLEDDSLFHSFDSLFKFGISYYIDNDYIRAISTFESLVPAIPVLQAKAENQELKSWIRDLYFYLGLSHFAHCRTRKFDLSEDVRTQHLDKAVTYLSKADSLVQLDDLEGGDRENYFLGLAHWLEGEKDLAAMKLKKISPNSEFYEESVKLIQK